MKKLSNKETEALRRRWLETEPFQHVVQLLREHYFGKGDLINKWFFKNGEAHRRLCSVTISDWLVKTDKYMFTDHFPMTLESFDWLPKYRNEELGRMLLDFRGYANDTNMCDLTRAYIENADFSYAYGRAIGGFDYGTLRDCVFVKASLRFQRWGHYYKSCYFQDCDLSETSADCTYIEDCQFVRCKFRNPRVFTTHVKNSTFENCSFRSVYFAYGVFINCRFPKSNFSKARMETSRFINCTFEDCEWTKEEHKSRLHNYDKPIVEEIPPEKIDPVLLKE